MPDANFASAEMGSARWKLALAGNNNVLCISTGYTIVARAYARLVQGNFLDPQEAPEAWRNALQRFIQAGGLPSSAFTLLGNLASARILTNDANRAAYSYAYTKLILYIAFYWQHASWDEIQMYPQGNVVPLTFDHPGTPSFPARPSSGADATAPVCYGGDVLLRPVGQDPNGPLPLPIEPGSAQPLRPGTTPAQTQTQTRVPASSNGASTPVAPPQTLAPTVPQGASKTVKIIGGVVVVTILASTIGALIYYGKPKRRKPRSAKASRRGR